MKHFTSCFKKTLGLLLLSSFSMFSVAQESATDTGVYTVRTSMQANDNFIVSVASEDGFISVSVNDGEATEYEVSNDYTKKTPLMFSPGIENAIFTIKGDITAFDAVGQKINSFDATGNNSLVLLNLSQNNLTNISLGDGENIRYCYLLDNAIEDIDLGKAVNIEEFNINYNYITDIDISSLKGLKAFSCDHNAITSLDVTQNLNLESLYCKKNELETLDISNQSMLRELSCESNKIGSIDVTNNPALELLYCKNNKITELNLGSCPNLIEINCSENEIPSLDLTNCESLLELYCFTNRLESLDLSNNPALTTLSCGDNALTSMDVSGHQSLESVSLSYNSISDLKLTDCPTLMAMAADHNKLSAIDFTGCPFLFMADISFNNIKDDAAAQMAATLPERSEDEPGFIIFTNSVEFPEDVENNECSASTMELFNNKYWILVDGEDEFIPTGISATTKENEISAIYDLNGMRVNSLSNGLNIIILKNGNIIKIMR